MTQHSRDDLWRDFPKTATEFEARFATEEDCRAYWIEARWGGKPACARCGSTYVWTIRDGTTFQCADCRHQTSLTAGTLLEKTHKPLKMWFRAVFEISTRRTGISAKDLQRIMGFGSYKTAWTWLHKLRAALVRPDREPLGPFVQMDEALVGGKGGPHKELVLVAAEADGRVRLAHAETNDKATLKRFADGQVARDAHVTTDGLASYDSDSLGERPYERVVQTQAERRESDTLQVCHWTISLLKRWLLGTHAGAVGPKHLQAYLDEYAFRHNRRRTNGVGLIAFLTLVDLFAAQAILPSLTKAYGVSPAAVGFAVNASTFGMVAWCLGVALVSRHLNRRSGIWVSLALLAVPTSLLAVAPDLLTFTGLRIAQGVFMAAAFTLTMAYLAEHCSADDTASALAAYVTGVVASNLVGRLVAGSVADIFGLAANFYLFAVLNLAGAALVFVNLDRMSMMAGPGAQRSPLAAWGEHLRNPALVAAVRHGEAEVPKEQCR